MSTSKLQEYTAQRLNCNLPNLEIFENYRPSWLQNPEGTILELDFYIPELRLAIEVQGRQHYVFSPPFHEDYNDFLSQQRRDEVKRVTCAIENIRLVEVESKEEVDNFVENLYLSSGEFKPDITIKKKEPHKNINSKGIKYILSRLEMVKNKKRVGRDFRERHFNSLSDALGENIAIEIFNNFGIELPIIECKHPATEIRYQLLNNNKQYIKKCVICGAGVGNHIKHKDISNQDIIKPFL
jgi:hypothetical protein